MGTILGLAIAILLSAVVAGLIIWLVSRLNLGLHVDNFGWAMLAGLFIGFVTNLIMQLVPATGDVLTLVVTLIVSAGVILLCGALFKGVNVNGYKGALIASVSIAVIGYLLALAFLGGADVVRQGTEL